MRNLISVVILMATLQCYAQNDLVRYRPCNSGCTSNTKIDDPIDGAFSYGPITTFETKDVVSDYGVRNAGKGATRFHQAIDYSPLQNNQDRGYALIAVKAGTVSNINGEDNYKGITIGNYRYTHIFKSELTEGKSYYKSGKFVLKKVQPKTGSSTPWAIIDLEYCRAFCQEAGRTVTVDGLPSTICESNTFPTINYVEEGWDIAPMGNSGGNFETHLHLERRENNMKHDPNQNVQHQSQDFEVALTTKNNTDVQLKYPGTIRNSLRLRATMKGGIALSRGNFQNVTMNLDKADILLQRDGSNDYEHIVGFEGKNKSKIESRFWLGANHNTQIYPNNWNSRNFGGWTQTGTYPYAHNDANNQIYDDYFFSNFYTRIDKTDHKKLIDIPTNARYNDGKYKLKPTVTNVKDELFTISGIDITLDNFQPYLTRINVNCNNSALYQVYRKADEGKNKINDDGTLNNDITNYSISANPSSIYALSIEIYTSEPMKNLKCAHRNIGSTTFSEDINMTKSSSNELKWTVILPLSYVMEDCVQLRFKGKDLSDNDLIDVYSSTNSNDILSKMLIPTRSSLTTWNNTPAHTGVDYVDFCLKTCSAFRSDDIASTRSNPCDLLNDVEADVSIHHCKSGTIELLLPNPTDYDISWTDLDGNDLYQYQNTTQIHVQTSTTLCYHITPLSECCKKSQCIEIILENFDLNVRVEEVVKECGCENKKAYVEINATNLQGFQYDYKYYWEDYPNINTYLRSLNIGSYKVSVTDDFGCFHEHTVTIHDFESSFNIVEDINNTSCHQDDGSIDLEIEALIDGTIPDFKISWSNGVQGTSIANLSHGDYCVTITQVFNNECKIIKCYTVDRERISIDAEITPTCLTEGSIEPQISGGTEPYSYSWSNDETTKNIYNLVAGTYYLLVEDVNGCWETAEFKVEVNDKIVVISNFTNLLDCNIPNGSIQVTPLISEHINYRWYNSLGTLISTNKDISNLERGTYRLIATSDSGCQTTLVQSICCCKLAINYGDPEACYIGWHGNLTVTGITTHTTNGLDNGSIVLSIQGGKGQTIFRWTGPNGFTSFDKDIFNLEIGQYTVTVTDGCQTIVRTFIINDESICENANLVLTGTTKCIIIGVSPGIVTTNVSGGTPPYTYHWDSDGSTNQNFSSYYNGSTVRVTDSNGCTISEYFSLDKSNPLNANFEILNPGDCSSKIDKLLIKVNITGGFPPFRLEMNQYTYNFNSRAYEVEIPITELLWIDRNFAFKLYDACEEQLFDYQKINCQDFCPQNRITFDFTKKGLFGCVDSYRDNATLEFIFSKWKYISPTNNDIEIDNQKDIDGRKRIKKQGTHIGGHLSAAGEQFIVISDHTIGCSYSEYFKVRECFNLWTWLEENSGNGNGSGGSDSGDCLPSEFKTIDKIIDFAKNQCEEKLLCKRTGETKTEKYKIKKCDVQDKLTHLWATIEYCLLECGYHLPIGSGLPSDPGNGKCPDCIVFANGGGDENEKINPPTCNESIINITMENDNYILFWQSKINEVNKLNGFSFKKSKNEVDFNGFSRFDFEEKVTQVRVDTAHNIYTISGQDTTIFQKYDISGNLQWSILLPNFQTKEISEGNLGNYSLIGKDQEINKWTKLSFTPDGTLVEVKGLPLSQQNYKIVHQSENTTIALQEDGRLAFATNLNQVTTLLPPNIIIKDIKTIENNKILVVGDFEGLVAIDSSTHNSNGFRNAIFLLFDKNGNFITSQSIQNNRNESVSGVFSHQSDEIAYHGYQNTSETDTQDSTFIISDSCLFVHVITLDYFCQRPAPELTFNEQTCQLIWNQSHNTEDLEIEINGIWYDVEEYFNLIEEPVSPYSIISDGYYRLVSRKTDCPTIYSNPIEVTCESGSCPTIIMTEPEYQNNCWAFDIFSSSSKEIKFVIKTWQEDPSIIQFIDSLSFITNDSLTSFMYCELPPEYQCFNYGQINIECLDCDTICEPFIFDWACIPRMTNTQNETTLNNVIRFYPNPFSKTINLEISSYISEQVTLQAYNSIGNMVFERNYDLTQGKNHKLIDGFEHVPSGVYTVKIKSKTKEFTARIIRVD